MSAAPAGARAAPQSQSPAAAAVDTQMMPIQLVITIDTEPDSQWEHAAAAPTFDNTRQLGHVHEAILSEGFRPTYLVTYSVARDEPSRALLRSWRDAGECEIGAHLHPWETPPLWGDCPSVHTYIYEYPNEVRREKLWVLTEQIQESFGVRPRSYRAGRWGIDATEIAHLAQFGYQVDTSIVPGWSFRRSVGREQRGPNFAPLLGCNLEEFPVKSHVPVNECVREIPVSTAPLGKIQRAAAARACATFTYALPIPLSRVMAKALKVCDLLKVGWLRPAWSSLSEMRRVVDWNVQRGTGVLNLAFHSSETALGTSPRTAATEALKQFYADLGGILDYLSNEYGASGRTLTAEA